MGSEQASSDEVGGLAWPWPQSVREFEAVVDAFQHQLVHFAFCRLRNLEDAEDVVQEVLIRAYRDREKHKSIPYVGPYLYRMVSNRCIDLLRKRKRIEVPLKGGEAEAMCTESNRRSESAGAAERQHRINNLLLLLPARQAEVIRLRVFAELPFDAIAQVVGRSVPTVKSRFRYGIQRLRKILSKGGAKE